VKLRGPLEWALIVHFYGMPVVLTLLAWDLYGGFAVHGRRLAAMGIAGALFGGLRARLADTDALAARGRAFVARSLVLGFAAQILVAAALLAGETLARLDLGPTPAHAGGSD
jgi:hypothetical protein